MNIKKFLPLVGFAIFLYILSTLDVEKIVTVFSSLNPISVLLALCSFIPIILLVNYEWQLILKKHRIHVTFRYSLKNIFIGYFYGFITPGAIGGYTRAYYLKNESGESLQKCLVNILLYNTLDYLALVSIGVAGGILLSSAFPSLLPIIFLFFLFTIVIIFFFLSKKVGKRIFSKLLTLSVIQPVSKKWGMHIDTLYEELPTPRNLAFPFILSLIGWTLWFSILYLITPLFAFHISYIECLAILAVANVIASIPISIYGLGTREAALIWLFSLFDIAPENVISFSLFWFVLSWLFPSILGAGVTLLESRRNKSSIQKTIEK
ncbi:MAG: lysylphosphatidylglycerol synthase transmembrane domain-containing protein [Euryarchaeota archaeon]|nr:lysylphosphatidylglycerol synthase transmembrane domain-containing protein [Euryarchaeota archaeon]